MFETYLRNQGLAAYGGQIIDVTLNLVPKQGNSSRDNFRLRQIGLDAHWVKKNYTNHSG